MPRPDDPLHRSDYAAPCVDGAEVCVVQQYVPFHCLISQGLFDLVVQCRVLHEEPTACHTRTNFLGRTVDDRVMAESFRVFWRAFDNIFWRAFEHLSIVLLMKRSKKPTHRMARPALRRI